MKTSSILDTYQTWLTHREYSPATIQKYTKALARFFADTGAGDIPTRETVAAWRDSLTEKGYTPATVNAMLAAVNDYQESIDNVAGKAKPLKHQRRIFADPGRELTRAEYFRLLNAARAAGNKRTQLLLEALCSTGIRVSGLQFITAEAVRRHKASIRCKGKCREILLPAELCHRLTRWCQKHRIHAGPVCWQASEPRNGLETAQSPVRARQCGREESFPPQPAAPVCADILQPRKKYLETGGPARSFQHRDDKNLYHGIRRRT